MSIAGASQEAHAIARDTLLNYEEYNRGEDRDFRCDCLEALRHMLSSRPIWRSAVVEKTEGFGGL